MSPEEPQQLDKTLMEYDSTGGHAWPRRDDSALITSHITQIAI